MQSQYSSLVAKLNRYDKEELASMLTRRPHPESITKREGKSIEASKVSHLCDEEMPTASSKSRQIR